MSNWFSDMMPSVVKANPAVGKEGSAAAGSVRKPTTLDLQRKRSQLLVSRESSQDVKSGECTGVASSKSSSAGCKSLKLADGSLRQKVDLTTNVVAGTETGRVVTARNPTVRTTRMKSSSSECAKSGTDGDAVKSSALKTTSASRVSNPAKTTAHRKSVVETSHRMEISSSIDKRKPGTVAASVGGNVKHEVSLNRCRVPAASQTKTSDAVSSLAAKKPRLRQANGSSSVTSRTSVKRDKASSAAVKLAEKKHGRTDNDDKCVSSRSSSSLYVSQVTELISPATVDGSDVKNDQVSVSNSVSISQESLPTVDTNSSLCNVCVVRELSGHASQTSDHRSHVTFESLHCESVRSGMQQCECVLKSADVTASISCIVENGSDLEETSVCDLSLNSCLSDCSTSLFHSACSSVIGSVSDMMKPPSVDASLETNHLATLLRSNSVSVESLHSSAGYCTPIEADSLCEIADCTLLNTDDSRYVHFMLNA